MNKKILTGSLLTILSFGTLAATPSYNYIDLGYANWKLDGFSGVDGFELKGSKQITDNLYIAGDFTRISGNGRNANLSTIGLGYLHNFSETSSFFAELDYANISPLRRSSENGFEVTVGVRSMLTSAFELKGAIEYLDVGGDTTSFVVGGAYSFTDKFAAYLDYKFESDINRLGAGVRFYF